jgi:hypothetical protein
MKEGDLARHNTPFIQSDPTMTLVIAIETLTARIAKGLQIESLPVLSSRSYLDLESRHSVHRPAKEDLCLE